MGTLAPGEHYIVVKPTADGQWTWVKRSANHETIAVGEGYTRRFDAMYGACRTNPEVTKVYYQEELPEDLPQEDKEPDGSE
jgi:uncharacterized protein YegP (UPF0339 family)